MDVYLHSPLLLSLLKILFILVASLLVNTFLRALIRIPRKLDTRRGRTYVSIVRSLISVIVFTIALHIIFLILGINIAPLLASAGIVGIAIGIGARSLIEDLIAGLFLLTQTTTAIGDYVIVGTNEGIIQDIGIRTITIRSINGALVVIPNGQVKQVVNYSWGNAVLFIDIPVKAGQKIENVIDILTASLTKMKNDKKRAYPIKEDSKVLGIENILAGSCILIRIMLVTSSAGRTVVGQEYRYTVVKTFEGNKIAFA